MIVISLLAISLQLAAAVSAFLLIKVTQRKTAWLLISTALLLMCFRRILTGTNQLIEIPHLNFWFDIFGLIISIFMFIGLNMIRPLFLQMAEARDILEKQKARAENANAKKNMFLAQISHEIRTPLTSIIGFIDLLNRTALTEDKKKEYLTIIEKNSHHLKNLVSEIMDFCKLESADLLVEKSMVNVNNEIRYVIELAMPIANQKGLNVTFMQKNEEADFVYSDALRLRQILINLIGNAIKYTHQGSVSIYIRKRKLNKHLNVEVVVEDTGIGINKNEQEKIFDSFYQVNHDFATAEGIGLGLALSRKMAKAIGGDLVLEYSEINKGSRFVLTVESNIKENLVEPAVVDLPSEKKLNNLEILVVEDCLDSQILIENILSYYGAKATIANDGGKALEILADRKFDLILSDIRMAPVDGYTFIKEMQKRSIKIPVIALTAHATKSEEEKCLAHGFNSYCSKPIDINKLLEVIQTVLAKCA